MVTNNTWYSIEAGPAHVVFLNNYVPYGNNSEMYKWFIKDMESVNRTRTPWVIVGFHAPWYHTYIPHYKENDEMRLYFEPAFFKYGVDAVFAGHVHAYERSPPVYQWQPNTCGPFYITIGDGGNIEGLYKEFVDQTTSVPGVNASIPKYCYNTSLWAPASYQPSYSGRGYIDPNTPFCFSSQPPWSDFRNPSFGYGMFTLINDTTARWQWNRNIDPVGVAIDDVYFKKNPTSTCNAKVVMGTELSANANAKGLVAPPASPGASPAAGTSPAAAPKSSASTASMVVAVLLACFAFLA